MKKWISSILFVLLLMLSLSACQQEVVRQRVNLQVVPMNTIEIAHDLPAVGNSKTESFTVDYHVKGDQVFVECMIPSISFREHSNNKGKLHLYVDDNKMKEITSAAFIIKGLSPGTHGIRIEVMKPNGQPYHLEKEFNVMIP